MKTRWLVVAILSLVLLIATAPPSTAYVFQSPITSPPSSPKDMALSARVAGSSFVSDSAPASPSSAPCTSDTFPGSVTVFYENFDSVTAPALPFGWGTIPMIGTQGVWQTSAGTVNPSGSSAASLPNLVYFNSRTAPAGSTALLYRGIPLDLSRYNNVRLCVNFFRDSGFPSNDDRVQVQLYTSGAPSWTDVGPPMTRYYPSTPTWWARYMSIASVADGQSAVFLGFLGISEQGNDFHLDDVQVVATQAQGLYLPLMFR